MNSKYISTTDTAKLIREILKVEFPGIKFSVRSKMYSGGSSIDIGWTDGPTAKQVSAYTGMFEGATFDGMIDLKSYVTITNEDGEEIHYGADFVFENREYSDALTQKVAERAAHYYGMDVPVMNEHGWYDRGVHNFPVCNSNLDNLADKISQWRQYAVWEGSDIKFISVGNQFLPGELEMINEHPTIKLSEHSYHPMRLEFEAARKANEPKTPEPMPIVEPVAEVESVNPIIAKLQTIDILNVTPLEALNILAELKKLAH